MSDTNASLPPLDDLQKFINHVREVKKWDTVYLGSASETYMVSMAEYALGLARRLAEVETANRWIPVEDGFPKNGEQVFVYRDEAVRGSYSAYDVSVCERWRSHPLGYGVTHYRRPLPPATTTESTPVVSKGKA